MTEDLTAREAWGHDGLGRRSHSEKARAEFGKICRSLTRDSTERDAGSNPAAADPLGETGLSAVVDTAVCPESVEIRIGRDGDEFVASVGGTSRSFESWDDAVAWALPVALRLFVERQLEARWQLRCRMDRVRHHAQLAFSDGWARRHNFRLIPAQGKEFGVRQWGAENGLAYFADEARYG